MKQLELPQRSHPGLRRLRLAHGLSQDELGFRAGVSQARLSRAERGYLRLGEEERQRIAIALGVELAELEQATTETLAAS